MSGNKKFFAIIFGALAFGAWVYFAFNSYEPKLSKEVEFFLKYAEDEIPKPEYVEAYKKLSILLSDKIDSKTKIVEDQYNQFKSIINNYEACARGVDLSGMKGFSGLTWKAYLNYHYSELVKKKQEGGVEEALQAAVKIEGFIATSLKYPHGLVESFANLKYLKDFRLFAKKIDDGLKFERLEYQKIKKLFMKQEFKFSAEGIDKISSTAKKKSFVSVNPVFSKNRTLNKIAACYYAQVYERDISKHCMNESPSYFVNPVGERMLSLSMVKFEGIFKKVEKLVSEVNSVN